MSSATVEIPFIQDSTIYVETDWLENAFIFYEDAAQSTPIDFSASAFAGEVLDKAGGTKLFDLTFNTPADDGLIWPKLTDAETATLTGKTSHYFVTVTTGGLVSPYFSGDLTISKNFKAGA
jgi:hypothetical protein